MDTLPFLRGPKRSSLLLTVGSQNLVPARIYGQAFSLIFSSKFSRLHPATGRGNANTKHGQRPSGHLHTQDRAALFTGQGCLHLFKRIQIFL